VVNFYINVKQLPTDGKVASVLCVGQPVKYKLKPNAGFTRQWLLTNIVPGISEQYEDDAANRIADILALPLLFAVMEPGCQDMVTPAVFGQVRAAWTQCVFSMNSKMTGTQWRRWFFKYVAMRTNL
jgi:hypothetical protein